MRKIKAAFDRILIEPIAEAKETTSGIKLTKTDLIRTVKGKVTDTGWKEDEVSLIPHVEAIRGKIKVGTIVHFGSEHGVRITGEKEVVMNVTDVLTYEEDTTFENSTEDEVMAFWLKKISSTYEDGDKLPVLGESTFDELKGEAYIEGRKIFWNTTDGGKICFWDESIIK